MLVEKIGSPVEDLIRLLNQVRDEARKSSLEEVVFMIELAITAALDQAQGSLAADLAAPRVLN